MSKVRIPINPKQVGRVGAYSMYVRAGEQIVRQRQNASNYGETASRTYAQQLRRVMWSNLVNQYRVLAFWQPRAYENIRAGQTDYNKFMSLNVNAATLPLTKQMASDGATIITPVIVSQGSLPSPVTRKVQGANVFALGLLAPSGSNPLTVGEFSALVIANNPNFLAGDALCFVGLRNWLDLSEVPRAACEYVEIVLDPTDSTLLSSFAPAFTLGYTSQNSEFEFSFDDIESQPVVAATCVHSRRNVSVLSVSTEKLVMASDDIINMFSGEEWLQECIDSYGVSSLVPLEPGADGKTYTAAFSKRVAEMGGNEVQFVAGGDGKLLQDSTTGNVLAFDTSTGIYEMLSRSSLPAEANTWGFTLTRLERGQGTFSAVVNGGLFTFLESSQGILFPTYPRALTYSTRVPA